MYRALIVDDEPAAREMIICLVDWKEIGFEKPDTATNGRQALELFRQRTYDIIFTDIEMPIMNGLEMIEEMKKTNPKQMFVIISCHESFEYAKKALKMGVSEYLIKDLMSSEELYACLLEHTAKKAPAFREKTGFQMQECSEVLLKLISEEKLTKQDEKAFREMMCLPEDKNCYSIGLASMDEKEQKHFGLDYQILCQTRRFCQMIWQEGTVAVVSNERDILFLIIQAGKCSTAEKMNQTAEYINHIRSTARECGITSLTIGVSEESGNIHDVGKLYLQAKKACNMKVFRGMNRTIFYNTIANNIWSLQGEALEKYLEQIELHIVNKDNRYKEILKKLYRPNLYGGFLENNYLSYVNWRLWNILFYIRRKIHGKEIPETDIVKQGVTRIDQLNSARDMEDFFIDVIQGYFILEENLKEPGIVIQAKDYIEMKMGEDISLTRIADALHVHKGYLCRVFREETGINLVSYIRERKVAEAKKMLESTGLKVYEIAEILGYQSPQYFTMVFKKESGLSPNDYRKQFYDK